MNKNKIDRDRISVYNNSQQELDQNQESSPLLRWGLMSLFIVCYPREFSRRQNQNITAEQEFMSELSVTYYSY